MKKTIGFVSIYDPINDRKAWSGTIFKLREGIENAGYEIKWIPYICPKWIYYLLGGLSLVIPGKSHPLHNRLYYKVCASTIDQTLFDGCDYIFFPGSSQMMMYLQVNVPVITFTDACYHQMSGYYWKPVNKVVEKEGNYCEKKSFEKIDIRLNSSDWAAKDAEEFYGYSHANNHVIEFGPNIDKSDIVPNIPYDGETLNVLFSGVDWERKGGDIAVEAVKFLNENGIKAILHICGIKKLPQKYIDLPYINNIGFLNKNKPEEYTKYINIIRNCNILLLPTKAECSAIVFPESSAFGLPIFTHDTGGIGNYVINGRNGYRLPLGSTGQDFGKKIMEVITSNELDKLRTGCIELYKNKLNWDNWSKRFKAILSEYETSQNM